jgi:hypothetical protein
MRVAVLGAGGPAGVNTLRALRAGGHECVAADADAAHLVYCAQLAETRHMPNLTVSAIDALEADVVIPQPDPIAHWFSQHGRAVAAKSLTPAEGTSWICQDKQRSSLKWFRAGLREHPPFEIEQPWPDNLHLAADEFGLPFWLRARRGAGAKGAILVHRLDQAYHWIRFWQSRDSDMEWIAEEYLPGRDLAWSSVWFEGELQASFARERLEYLYPHLTPEGLTGTPTRARIVHDEDVNAAAQQAVLAVDSKPHGIFSVDLREDVEGVPRPTEINCGRGFTTFGLWSLYGPNFLDLVVRLAAHGKDWWLIRPDLTPPERLNALPEGLTLNRHIDCGHTFVPKLRRALTLCA